MQDAKAKPFAQRAIDDHARVSTILPSRFARCWLTPGFRGLFGAQRSEAEQKMRPLKADVIHLLPKFHGFSDRYFQFQRLFSACVAAIAISLSSLLGLPLDHFHP